MPTNIGACELEQKFIVWKHLLCPVILKLDFIQDFRVGIDRNEQGQLYLHQDHKPLNIQSQALKRIPLSFLSNIMKLDC